MQIPKVVMSQELIDEYAAKYQGKNHAHAPYCRICSTTLDDVYNQLHRGSKPEFGQERNKLTVHYVYLGLGEQAYRALFVNRQLAYYHLKCLDERPVLKANVESRLLKIIGPIAVSP
jgi:hypothetical protein